MGKIKQFMESNRGKDILTVIIVILVGLGSFGLGRLSKEGSSAGIKIEYPNSITSQTNSQAANVVSSGKTTLKITPTLKPTNNNGKNFFASSRGSKYYPLGCEAGKNLKQENRVYFATKEAAETAGYQLSNSCQ